jgi:protein SCO1/2
MRRPLLIFAVVALLAALVAVLAWPERPAPSPAPAGPKPLADAGYRLVSASGPFDPAMLAGRIVLVYFGYTYCPDICPTSLAAVGEALKRLTPDELAAVATVFVSVDPQRDTPERLKDYAAFFHPTMIGLTGTTADIDILAQRFGAIYMRVDTGAETGYAIDHTAWTYVVAPDGRQVGKLPHGATVEQILSEIRKWLPAPSTPKGAS